MALYKGLKVAIESVDKSEISLTRQDLIELVNVRGFLLIYHLSLPIASCLYIMKLDVDCSRIIM